MKKANDDFTNEVKSKKISFNLLPENEEKINRLIKESGGVLTRTEVINKAIADIPIVCLGDRKSIATSFFEIRNALTSGDMDTTGEEVRMACQSLNLLMEKIEKISR